MGFEKKRDKVSANTFNNGSIIVDPSLYPFNETTRAVIRRLTRVKGKRTFQPNFMI
jgi:hypothetical protein